MPFTIQDKERAVRLLELSDKQLDDGSQLSDRMRQIEDRDARLGTSRVAYTQELIQILTDNLDARQEALREENNLGENDLGIGVKEKTVDVDGQVREQTEYFEGNKMGSLSSSTEWYDQKLNELKNILGLETNLYKENKLQIWVV